MILGALCVRTYRRVFDIFRFLLDVYINRTEYFIMPTGTTGDCAFGFVWLTETRLPYIDLALAITSRCRTPMQTFLRFHLRQNLYIFNFCVCAEVCGGFISIIGVYHWFYIEKSSVRCPLLPLYTSKKTFENNLKRPPRRPDKTA